MLSMAISGIDGFSVADLASVVERACVEVQPCGRFLELQGYL